MEKGKKAIMEQMSSNRTLPLPNSELLPIISQALLEDVGAGGHASVAADELLEVFRAEVDVECEDSESDGLEEPEGPLEADTESELEWDEDHVVEHCHEHEQLSSLIGD